MLVAEAVWLGNGHGSWSTASALGVGVKVCGRKRKHMQKWREAKFKSPN
jgi:hypothetical protein